MRRQEILKVIREAVRQNAEFLDLRSSKLVELPSEIGQLTNLKKLVLRGNQLSELPPEIGHLINLEILDLRSNRLLELPSEIGQLTNLKKLAASQNQLIELPSEIGQLQNLELLDLRSNKLVDLPPEIGQLTSLTILALNKNQFLELEQIDDLRDLAYLFSYPKELPPEIKQCINNPQEAAQKIPRYYRQILEQETDRLYEAKLLIVGEGGAGKTSLARKIDNESYVLDSTEQSTKGIDIIQWQFPLGNDRDFRVNIWDFGGQEIYHATHQFFLTKRSLYILVADSRKEDTDFFYWLNVVGLLSKSSPIMIVKNEKQDRQREIDERQLRGEFTNLGKVLATNLANNRGLTEIKRAIQQNIATLPHVGVELPKTWVKVRKALEDTPRNHITLEEYLKLCKRNGFTRQEDALQLSEYLHDLGVCLHFQDDDLLRKTVILKPTWGTDAVYKVLDNPKVIANLGKFDRGDLASIWYEKKYSLMRRELLRLMENFKLCYEIPGSHHQYIAPQLLSLNKPQYRWDEVENILLRYTYEFMPKGILTRFIVEMHRWIENQTHVWKTGVVLDKDGAKAEVIELYHRKEIRIRVSGRRRRDLLTTVRHELDKIHSRYERLKSKTLVPCSCETCREKKEPFFYPFDKLQERISNGKNTIECGDPPYLDVSIFSLIDDVNIVRRSSPRDVHSEQSMTRDQIFVSYSHLDQAWLGQFQTLIKPLIRSRMITVWDDTHIQAGSDWRQDINCALASAKVAVLLVSPSFLASDFIADNELPPLLDAAEHHGLTIIWIPISHSLYSETKIEKYQAAHSPNYPLDSLNSAEQNQAWVSICKKIKAAYFA
ncbi:COR domain-containing protein [Adonisia turfae]|uniref:non-specific serine/threonine protein kinase n=1 Tax=Adonisia turfae CCMR0081 TaxID=2292702 RepID=A0A6M0RY31_9CYAN|nr:COR domain-containing protein [Adonisia turfae]NEZ60803.1 TIR domain-containing protein [Adonisia turfae CCMR0081]